ncbi:CHAP domain-containing protein [Mobilicoccus pelagius]|uniref:Peptidase C51 domain-containing protein n=1 Tax=Mobilicoccus pelagius NBRC 104925 TaxID=1089455 RepID=H5UV92_9MICO|nr:CHAP domain-containing protein [Mobilicoccus pelagius]GAB49650.1 hypothetical protein MOPEL_132_00170 [Mobilicoccus pelagius NBRC 104925]
MAKESGRPLKNPNSGSWRIPGVYTLEEYFLGAKTFHAADSGYTPKLGDVVMYRPDSPYGQHTNYVLSVHDGILTTVGGNEDDRIVVSDHRLDSDLRVVGYGER